MRAGRGGIRTREAIGKFSIGQLCRRTDVVMNVLQVCPNDSYEINNNLKMSYLPSGPAAYSVVVLDLFQVFLSLDKSFVKR